MKLDLNPTSLLSIADVRARVIAQVTPHSRHEAVPLHAARGRVLAQALTSPRALPVFDHSAMDGYALALDPQALTYRLVGRVIAGTSPNTPLQPGEAVRIFTGAPIPTGATCVIMQEQVAVSGDTITPQRPPSLGDNIRRAGEDVPAHADLAPAGTLIDARHMALAAAAGLTHLTVRAPLRVALLSTGNELVAGGSTLGPGQIFDSNRPMIAACLDRPAVEIVDFGILPDDPDRLRATLLEAARTCDLIVTTGGASVGDEDHLAQVVRTAGGTISVARAAIRPGKPVTFGAVPGPSGPVPIAILPGNPFAALVTTLLFVRPMVEKALGLAPAGFAPLPACADFSGPRTKIRTEFMPAKLTGRVLSGSLQGLPMVARLGRGGSARLYPLIEADGLAVITPGEADITPGTLIGYLPFGTAFAL